MDAIALTSLRFGYRATVDVLSIPSLIIPQGEHVFIFGPSGSGKTTLLGLLAGVLTATSGTVTVLGHNLTTMTNTQRDAFRGIHIGYIFQLFNLIPYLNVKENIELPCRLHPARRQRLGNVSLDQAVQQLSDRLGLRHVLREPVTTLSVGQQQRVGAARALLGSPELIVADEPTSALDHDMRTDFLTLLFECCRTTQATLIFVSHDRTLQPFFDRTFALPQLNTVEHKEPYGTSVSRLQVIEEPTLDDCPDHALDRLEYSPPHWR
ncbi:MAG: ABC transporter ATP-binding protein [Deltaproteobacteria bacterium]|nr:ABC transporter ATP-binding protein [Deltaproteobacteria bacterium]